MRSHSSKLTTTSLIIYFVLLGVFLCQVFFRTDLQDFVRAFNYGISNDYSERWTLDNGQIIDVDNISSEGFGTGVIMSKTLPETMEETDSVCFTSSNLNFEVYVDDSLIYSYKTLENFTGTGDGIAFHLIGLGTKDQGKTMRIEGRSAFSDGYGGRINEIQFGKEEQFRYYLMRNNLLSVALSFLIFVFGLVILIFFFGMSKKNPIMRPIWGLGVSSVLFGTWSICDTGIPQLLAGTTYASRMIVYGILHLAGLPMVYFVNCFTKNKRSLYLNLSFITTTLSMGALLFARYALGMDMHSLVGIIYFSYASELIWLTLMLIDNEAYCRKKKISSDMFYFYMGVSVFVAFSFMDMIRYVIGKKSSVGRGSWFRFGLTFFLIFLGFQIFDWWSKEKTSLERDRFVNRLLQYIMDAADPEEKINKVLKYLCEELHADRAYIFEDMKDGTFDNTYEFCAPGVTPEIDNLKNVPFKGTLDVWYDEYKKGGHVLIYDLEKYREVSESLYNVLKPQDIQTLVTGPLILNGEYIGFFGVDNPPAASMNEISEIIRLLMYFLSELVANRDNHRRLLEYSYHDSLTGVGNRRALKEYEKEVLDTARPYGFIMCDINGLKAVNDNEGHEAGDELIKTVAGCLTDVFGAENVFRMGGDEFSVYVSDNSRPGFEKRIEKIRKMVAERGFHVAIGYSYAENGDPDYNSRKIEADNRMYDEKRDFYRNDNDRRRRQKEDAE